ncbi:hypothetical protein K458DRAFT_325951 [Lentithecium fluviatile CBS 122367]|uniref:Ima1 N-terminal domain-containing protein n=1 Tax=Lentithecium fluviatile CBS 122367 TaxID=1168545 RepID=A0A6G1JPD3_9PLEO|nr:hypothetical protein K458DRAFT_325951 [Lentithecium fluviatile CBS 122367]
MPGLLRRKLRCHYCNACSRNDQAGIPRTWMCPYCEAVNHLDDRGEITDPPAEAISTAPPPPKYARSRSPTPVMFTAPAEPLFCETCQRNQMLLNKTLAEYIPDEDDPEYEKYANSVDEYRAELEERYPQVCENCIDRVQDQIRAAGYAAKADHLRRRLEESKKYQAEGYTPRQFWTLAITQLAKCVYIGSVALGLVWHGFGAIAATDRGHNGFSWEVCVREAFGAWAVSEDCLVSPFVLWLAKYALIADLLTIWWNPMLVQKTNRAGGRMRGLFWVWCIRIALLAFRLLGHVALTAVPADPEELGWFRNTHAALFGLLLLGTLAAWNSVRIVYQSTKSLMQPLDAHLPNAPHSAEKPKPSISRKPLPNNTSFDTMAQSFTSSFRAEPTPTFPPSPTLTSVSSTTQESDFASPYKRKSIHQTDDSMDWTPTQKRFAPHAPSLIPFQWSHPQPPSSPPQQPQYAPIREPVSLFSKPDPNPFRHKVPPAPKAPLASKLDPWKPGVWAPPLKESTTNFFKEERKGRGAGAGAGDRVEEGERGGGLQGVGVPRKVQRDAELFAPPRLRYDHFGEMKETGLEDTFNGLFSK